VLLRGPAVPYSVRRPPSRAAQYSTVSLVSDPAVAFQSVLATGFSATFEASVDKGVASVATLPSIFLRGSHFYNDLSCCNCSK
jgi:hypothetical protein